MPDTVVGIGDKAMNKNCGIYRTEVVVKGMDPQYRACQMVKSTMVKNKPGVF